MLIMPILICSTCASGLQDTQPEELCCTLFVIPIWVYDRLYACAREQSTGPSSAFMYETLSFHVSYFAHSVGALYLALKVQSQAEHLTRDFPCVFFAINNSESKNYGVTRWNKWAWKVFAPSSLAEHVHARTHARTHTRTHTHTHTCKQTQRNIHSHVRACACKHECVCVSLTLSERDTRTCTRARTHTHTHNYIRTQALTY